MEYIDSSPDRSAVDDGEGVLEPVEDPVARLEHR